MADFISKLLKTYDKTFLASMALGYFNNGFSSILTLAFMLKFKDFYHLSPAQIAHQTALIKLPWTPKMLYGFWTDSVPLFGSRKRNYLVVMGLLYSLSLLWLACHQLTLDTYTWLLVTQSFACAVMDVVVDGIVVV